jgi:hypothetical protein
VDRRAGLDLDAASRMYVTVQSTRNDDLSCFDIADDETAGADDERSHAMHGTDDLTVHPHGPTGVDITTHDHLGIDHRDSRGRRTLRTAAEHLHP